MTGYADTYVLRVAGLSPTWSTAPLVYDPTASPTLHSVPGTLRQRLEVLKARGSDAGIEVGIVFGDDVAPLLSRTVAPVVNSLDGAPLRLAEAVTESTTALVVDSTPAGLAPGDVVHVGGEAVKVSSVVGTTINVTRGSLGSVPAPIPAGVYVLAAPGTVIGARVTLSRVDYGGTVEAVIYRGRIQSITVDAGIVRLSIGSTWSILSSRAYSRPKGAAPASSRAAIVRGSSGFEVTAYGTDGPLRISLGDSGTVAADVTHAWIGSGDVWALASVTVAAGGYVTIPAGSTVWQVLDAGRVLGAAEVTERWIDTGAEFAIGGVEAADVLAGPLAPSAIVEAVIASQRPGTMRGGLDSAEVGDLSPLDRALGLGSFASPLLSPGDLVVLPRTDARKIVDLVADLLEPIGVTMVPDSQGRIAIVDPVGLVAIPPTLDGDAMRAPLLGWTIDDRTALRGVTISAPFEGVDLTVRVVSAIASQLYAGGVDLDVAGGLWSSAPDSLRNRWRSLVAWMQRGVPVLAAQVERGTPLDVGDVVLVDCATVPDGAGVRGVSDLLCSVIERGETTRTGIQSVTLLALGHGLSLRLGTWSPAAVVSAYVAGVATVGTRYTGTDDAAPFQVGQSVILCDANGTRIDTDSPPAKVTAIGALSLTVTFATATPAATDRIVLASYDDVSASVRDPYAWQADDGGALGAAPDPAFTWG